MDLGRDILHLAEKVAHVPGLSIAFSLAMQIMKSVQTYKWNTARLQYLAHLVADCLVKIAEQMAGKRAHAPPMLTTRLDEFEKIFRDIQNLKTIGTPEFVPLRLSFDPEPIWLNQPKGDFDNEMFEVKDGFSLTSFLNNHYEIEYLQLPIGVAKPYITEV